MRKIKFDQALQQLRDITDTLEQGDLGLEESVKLYEKGMDLILMCQQTLGESESRIDILTEKIHGGFELQAFQMEKSEETEVKDEMK